jgi:DNA repair exonuclease SbcCD nuclease subunit
LKVAFITDQHFGVRANSDIFMENYRCFYRDVFFPTLKKMGIKRIVGMGDFWENRVGVTWKTLKLAREIFFDPMAEAGIEYVAIYGNHDVTFRNTNDVNGMDFLGDLYENVKIIKDYAVMNLDGVKFGLIGWINKENLAESMEWLNTVDADFIAGHFEINDFEMTKGHVATHGFERDTFKRFDHVYSGHFHVRGTIGNITYLSNPSQTSWGDHGLEKGFHVFDSKTRKMEPVNNPFDMYKEIEWGAHDAKPEDFAGKYGRINIRSFEDFSRAELDLFVNAAQEHAIQMQVVEYMVEQDGVVVEADEVPGIWGIIDGYIEEAVGAKDGIDTGTLKKQFRELYTDASANLEVL